MTPSPRVLHNAKASAHMYAQCNAHTCAITHNTHTGYGRGCRECTWTRIHNAYAVIPQEEDIGIVNYFKRSRK